MVVVVVVVMVFVVVVVEGPKVCFSTISDFFEVLPLFLKLLFSSVFFNKSIGLEKIIFFLFFISSSVNCLLLPLSLIIYVVVSIVVFPGISCTFFIICFFSDG